MIYVRTGEIIFVILRIRELKKSNLKSQKHKVESKNQNWKSPDLGIDYLCWTTPILHTGSSKCFPVKC